MTADIELAARLREQAGHMDRTNGRGYLAASATMREASRRLDLGGDGVPAIETDADYAELVVSTMRVLADAILPAMLDDWMRRPHHMLQRDTPLERIRQGRAQDVRALGEAIAAGVPF